MSAVTDASAAITLQDELLALQILKFRPAYLLEVTATGVSKLSLGNYQRTCVVPNQPKSVKFTDDPREIDAIITKEVAPEKVTAYDTESTSWSTPFAEWPQKFQDRFTFTPDNTLAKGPFAVLLSIATLDGRAFVFDVRKCGLTPALRWYFSSPNMPKLVWDLDCERKVLHNSFGPMPTTADQGFIDVQNWAKDTRVQNGSKTSLSDFVALFRSKNIMTQKERFHKYNWNTVHWRFADTKEAIWYSACDSVYNLQVAAGLAATLVNTPAPYRTMASRLRTNAFKI